MPAVARAQEDDVFSRTGGPGRNCPSPRMAKTGSPTHSSVYVNGFVVVIQGDAVGPHPRFGCGPDTSTLDSHSSTVFVNSKGLGRIGDQYTTDNVIVSGSETVFCG